MKNECPLISVIVPIYNAENYLHRCIESVINQSYEQLEILLVDDGSSDTSVQICEKYGQNDRRIRTLYKKNGGVSSARNFGIDQSNGELIMFLDADDALQKDACETLFSAMKIHGADVVAGTVVGSTYEWKLEKEYLKWKGTEGLSESLKDNPLTYSAWGKLYKKSAIADVRFNNDYRINEDSFFVFEILCRRPTYIGINKEVYKYFMTPESASHSAFSDKYLDILKVSDRKYSTIRDKFPELLPLAENMRIKAKMSMLSILASRTGREYRQLEMRLLKEIRSNVKFYIPATNADRRWMIILKHHMYWPFKLYLKLYKSVSAIARI